MVVYHPMLFDAQGIRVPYVRVYQCQDDVPPPRSIAIGERVFWHESTNQETGRPVYREHKPPKRDRA